MRQAILRALLLRCQPLGEDFVREGIAVLLELALELRRALQRQQHVIEGETVRHDAPIVLGG